MAAEPTETNKQHLADILLKCSDDQLPDVLARLVKWQMWSAVNTILEQRTVADELKLSAIEEACKRADKFELVAILKHLTTPGDSILIVLMNHQKWLAVFDILQRKTVSDVVLKWVLEEAFASAALWEIQFYITLLPQTVENLLVLTLAEHRKWEILRSLLERGVSKDNLSIIIEKARETASDHEFMTNILSFCPEDQHLPLIQLLAGSDKWCSLRTLLHKIVVQSLKAWASSDSPKNNDDVTDSPRSDDDASDSPRSNDDVTDSPRSNDVTDSPRSNDVTDSPRNNDVTDSPRSNDVTDSPRSNDDASDKIHERTNDLISLAMTQNLQVDVSQVFKHKCSLKDEHDEDYCDLPWHSELSETLYVSVMHIWCSKLCTGSRDLGSADSMNTTVSAVYEEIQSCVGECLVELGELSEQSTSFDDDDMAECFTDTLNKRKRKQSTGFDDDVAECFTNTLNKHKAAFLELAESAQKQPYLVLAFLRNLHVYISWRNGLEVHQSISRGKAATIDKILFQILTILPLFPEVQQEALKLSVKKERWNVLRRACLSNISENTRRLLFTAAADQKHSNVIQEWTAAGYTNEYGNMEQDTACEDLPPQEQKWDVMEHCMLDDEDYDSNMLDDEDYDYSQDEDYDYSQDDYPDHSVTELYETVLKMKWKTVLQLLQDNFYIYPNEANSWSLMELYAHASEELVRKAVRKCMSFTSSILQFAIKTLLERNFWDAIEAMMVCDRISTQQRKLVFEKAFEFSCNDLVLFKCGVEHCPKELGDFVLTRALKCKRWNYVSMLLEKTSVSDSLHRQAVEEAMDSEIEDMKLVTQLMLLSHTNPDDSSLKRLTQKLYSSFVSDKECFAKMALKCFDDQLDTVMKKSVTRKMWKAVGDLLNKRKVAADLKIWAVEEACLKAKKDELDEYILENCVSQAELDTALKVLVKRGEWQLILSDILEHREVSENLNLWVMLKACKTCCDSNFLYYLILDHHIPKHFPSILRALVREKRWDIVRAFLHENTGDSDGEENRAFVIQKAAATASDSEFADFMVSVCPRGRMLSLIPLLAQHEKWQSMRRLFHTVLTDAWKRYATSDVNSKSDDLIFEAVRQDLKVDIYKIFDFSSDDSPPDKTRNDDVFRELPWSSSLSSVLYRTLLQVFCKLLRVGAGKALETQHVAEESVDAIYTEIRSCFELCTSATSCAETAAILCKKMKSFTGLADLSRKHPFLVLYFLRDLHRYNAFRKDETSDNILLVIFTILPLFPVIQVYALMNFIKEKNWDVLQHACLSYVSDNSRRRMFRAAVEQKQWTAVKAWTDHNLHDDLRTFAIDEAFRDKQWEAMLLLTDHGLDMGQLMRVHYRIAKYANWNVVVQMLERGGDASEVKDLIQMNTTEGRRATSLTVAQKRRYTIRCERLTRLEKKLKSLAAKGWKKAPEKGLWGVVLFKVNRGASDRYINLATDAAIEKKAWHVVVQLVKVGMSASKRNELFPAMVKDGRWTVCRALLDRGVSLDLCKQQLPVLMENHQWLLVAACMEYDVGDDLREQVMQAALTHREGSVVWQCIRTMHRQLSITEREQIFRQAMVENIWQAVKPLIEWSDSLGIQQRDTAMLAAIEQHMWDVVDRCQWYRANIDMKDEKGETRLHIAAKRTDWIAVRALVERDADPNLLDASGYSVLNRTIESSEWDTVKVLIEYHGDIHQQSKSGYYPPDKMQHHKLIERPTPLQLLIAAKQGKLLDLSLLWCPDQGKVVNGKGETTLHAACLSGEWKTLYYQIARGVSPLSLTLDGQSALFYAVQNTKHPQKMVAECIKLGLSTHQPALTDRYALSSANLLEIVIYNIFKQPRSHSDLIKSPFLLAVLKGLPVVAQMLYESGACSNRELFRLHKILPRLFFNSWESEILQDAISNLDMNRILMYNIYKVDAPLKTMATTPRSLKSSCRLTISHRLPLEGKRHIFIQDLDLLSEDMRNYVLFTDLTSRHFGKTLEWAKDHKAVPWPCLPLPPVPPYQFDSFFGYDESNYGDEIERIIHTSEMRRLGRRFTSLFVLGLF